MMSPYFAGPTLRGVRTMESVTTRSKAIYNRRLEICAFAIVGLLLSCGTATAQFPAKRINPACPGMDAPRQHLQLDPDLLKWPVTPEANQYSVDMGLQQVMQARKCEKVGELNWAIGHYESAANTLGNSVPERLTQQLHTHANDLREKLASALPLPTRQLPAPIPGRAIEPYEAGLPNQPQATVPSHPTAFSTQAMKLGMQLFNQKLYVGAIPYFSRVIQADPGNDQAFFYRGIARKLGGDPDILSSDVDIDRARQLNPAKRSYYTNMAAEYLAGRLVGPEGMQADWERNHKMYECSGYVDQDANAACRRGDITTANELRLEHTRR